jgi:hypothetical protein
MIGEDFRNHVGGIIMKTVGEKGSEKEIESVNY